jgi:hypothetical protein
VVAYQSKSSPLVERNDKYEVEKCGEKRRQKPSMKLETGTAQIQCYHPKKLRGEQTWTVWQVEFTENISSSTSQSLLVELYGNTRSYNKRSLNHCCFVSCSRKSRCRNGLRNGGMSILQSTSRRSSHQKLTEFRRWPYGP